MKRILDGRKSLESKLELVRRQKKACRIATVCLRPTEIKGLEGNPVFGDIENNYNLAFDDGDSDQNYSSDEQQNETDYVAGVVSSRSNSSYVPRWRLKKFTYITFEEEADPKLKFTECAPWMRDMLISYHQVRSHPPTRAESMPAGAIVSDSSMPH